MKKLSFTVAAAASALALCWAGTSRADDTTVVAPAPAQPAPQPVVVQQPAPAAQTTTTSASYAPPPQGQEMYAEKSTEHRPNRTLMSTGVGLFVISYGASVVAGAVSPRDEDKNLFIPVAGPWMDLGQRGNINNDSVAKGMLITSGIVQGAGVLLGLSSLVIPESDTTVEKRQSAKAEVHVLPVSFGDGAGVGAIGRF